MNQVKTKKILLLIIIIAAFLRLPFLDQFPAGLNADEAAIGYNAWSLIQTGKDEHSVSWPLVFRSFDDYKPPLYFYLVLPFVKLLGLNIWAVRLPSALLGVLSVYLTYLLSKELFKSQRIGLLSALILAVSPWHLQFSRGGWEVNAASSLILLGVFLFTRSRTNPKLLLFAAISLVLSMYTYHSARLIAPLLSFLLLIIYHRELIQKRNLKFIVTSLLIATLFCLPLFNQMLSKSGQSRFAGVSIFADEGPLWHVLEQRRLSPHPESFWTKLRYNRYLAYSGYYVRNYLSHFSPNFLFVQGDAIERSKTPGVGQAFLVLAPFFYFGVFLLLKCLDKGEKVILVWLLLSPVAAALTYQSPHALRSQNMVIPLTITTALALNTVFTWLKSSKGVGIARSATILASFIFITSALYYLFQYYYTYPRQYPTAWEYGFEQLAAKLKTQESNYDRIVISDRYDQPYIIMAFFLKYPPEILQQELVMTPRDKFGFSTVRHFGKYEFRPIDYSFDSNRPNTLLVVADETVPSERVIDRIISPSRQPIFRLLATDK